MSNHIQVSFKKIFRAVFKMQYNPLEVLNISPTKYQRVDFYETENAQYLSRVDFLIFFFLCFVGFLGKR